MKKTCKILLLISLILTALLTMSSCSWVLLKMSTVNPWFKEKSEIVNIDVVNTSLGREPNVEMKSYFTDDPELIGEWVSEQQRLYQIEKIAIDSFRYALLSKTLKEVGFDANDKQIKLVRPSDIMLVQPKINSIFLKHRLKVGDDPLFRWFTNNTKLEPAPNNNFKYGKIEPKSRKTDGFMAFVMAMTLEEELPEIYEMDFLDPIIL